ncbi:MAG TPA: amidohydrolase [Gemmatimonadaceae bacterium]|nr:amidohydrolase [Gemmatimonadaceae bacterium]
MRISVVCFLTLLPVAAQAQASAVLPPDLAARIAAIEPKVVAWRRDIHQHPELGNREVRTAKIVADHLRSLGIEVQEKVAHTGVVGILRGGRPGPVVLLRADMDGLPVTERVNVPFASKVRSTYNGQEVGVMHACGHDTHVAILMGTAEVLAAMRATLPGTVKFMFQPAEEGAPAGEEGGAELMVKEGILENPKVDVGFALHIDAGREVNTIGYTPGGMAASSDDFRILVKGKQTHGAAPWNGVDPVVTSAHIITAFQTIVSRSMDITQNPAIVTVGRITGGVRNNIVPEQVEMIGTIRALHPDDRRKLHDRVRKIATDVASSMGATVEIAIGEGTAYPVTFNNVALTEAMLPALREAAGASKVHLEKPQTGAEDFSFVAEKVPGFYISLGGRPANVPKEQAADHHTPDFYIDDSGLDVGVRALTALTLHYMRTNPRR